MNGDADGYRLHEPISAQASPAGQPSVLSTSDGRRQHIGHGTTTSLYIIGQGSCLFIGKLRNMSGWFSLFTNCRYVLDGQLVDDHLVISDETGLILKRDGYIGGEAIDLEDSIIAPGFLELHTSGANGFHFTHYENEAGYSNRLDHLARYYVTQGVTGFWATLPAAKHEEFQKILPSLQPRTISNSASLLGAHVEGPYLQSSKKGAQDASLFQSCNTPPSAVYGTSNLRDSIRLVTLAPELTHADALIKLLTAQGIKVSMGHSMATYEEGLLGIQAGATGLTHTLDAMPPFTSRQPGLAGLIALPTMFKSKPYYTIVADGEHLHPSAVNLLYRCNPRRSILVSDSTESVSLTDDTYLGHAQIPCEQVKNGVGATIKRNNRQNGNCATLQGCMRNLMHWSGCGIAEAVATVTENAAAFMGIDGEGGRGILKEGRRADLTVLSEQGEVLQTWIAGRKVWDRDEEIQAREDDADTRKDF